MSAELKHVPTAPELALQGHAREIVSVTRKPDGGVREDRRWQLTAEGQRLVYEAQAHNAAVLKADPHLQLEAERNAFGRRR